jgi:hypothetical protein
MKNRILTVFAALVSLGLFLELSPHTLQNTRLAWINLDFLSQHDHFYFKKRQWLADARTVVAGIRFLYERRTASQNNPLDVADVQRSAPPQVGNSNNLSGIERPAS